MKQAILLLLLTTPLMAFEDKDVHKLSVNGECSGTLVGEGTILTAAHCVIKLDDPVGATVPGHGNISKIYKVFAYDITKDLAVVIEHTVTKPDFSSLHLQDDQVFDGKVVSLQGYPGGTLTLHKKRGTMVGYSVNEVPGLPVMLYVGVDEHVFGGMSGGPVFNEKKELVGVISAGNAFVSQERSAVTLIVPVVKIREFVDNIDLIRSKNIAAENTLKGINILSLLGLDKK